MRREILAGIVLLVVAALVGWMISCGGNGGGISSFDGTIELTIGSQGQDIPLILGETQFMAFTVTYDTGRFGGPFAALTLNLEDNLAGLTFEPTAGVTSAPGQVIPPQTMAGYVTLRVAAIEAVDTVCTDGEPYGPFEFRFDNQYQVMEVLPSSAEATQSTIDIINIGAYSVCVQVVSPVNAVAGLSRVEFQAAQCADPPADIAGLWQGNYECVGTCPEQGIVTLTITQDSQDPSRASYTDDGGATYNGSVCGNRFSFRGGIAGLYDESGTFVMDPSGTSATKTSSYTYILGTCSGTCTDSLSQID